MLSHREPKAPDPGEVAEVVVASDQAQAVVEARLGDQRIGEPRAPSSSDQLRPKKPGPLPEARLGFEDRELSEQRRDRPRKLRSLKSSVTTTGGRHT